MDASGEEARSTTVPTAASVVPGPFRALEQMLPETPPAGFLREADGDASAGPVDVREAVLEEGRGDSLRFFADAGFVRGYQRRFVDGLRVRRIDVWVLEFAAPTGAAAYVVRTRADAPGRAAGLAVDTVLGSTGWLDRRPDESRAVVLFAAGSRAVRVDVLDPDPDAAVSRVEEIAELVDRLVPRSPAERAAEAGLTVTTGPQA